MSPIQTNIQKSSEAASVVGKKIRGAEVLIEALLAEGVEVIFGYPGGANLEIYDALHAGKVKHVLVRHEQGAAHAADGYARASGKVGVCLATSGPGATNLVTGIATAHMDSIPMVAITGQVPTTAIGTDAFQEADTTGITLPITKHNYLVKDAHDLARIVKEAFYIARSGRPGPVLIDIPKDVTKQMVEYKPVENISVPSYQPTYKGNTRQIHHFWRHVEAARKPVFVVGGGAIASNAAAEVREFVKISKIPIIQTLMGLGVYPIDGEYSLGMPGMHGTAYANYALNAADLLISIGMRFDDRITGKLDAFAKHAKIIHIDIDPAEINKCKHAHLPIIGDAVEVLKEVIAESANAKIPDFSAWHAEVSEWQKKYPLVYEDSETILKPQKILQEMNKILKGNAIVSVDVGEHQMWTAQYLSHQHPRHWLSSSGLGTMGFGLPASIGAHYANPQIPSINISGDGGVQMNIQELGTIAAEKLPIKTFIFNNKYLGMVRQWQELFYEHRYSSVDLEMGQPDFVKLAEAYGILGLRCDNPKNLVETLKKALNHPGPVVVDFVIAREAGVYPMVPAGGTVDQMIVFEDK